MINFVSAQSNQELKRSQAEFVTLSLGCKYLQSFLLFFLFLISFFSSPHALAQVKQHSDPDKKAQITIIGGAQIYSADPSFNKQVASKHIQVNTRKIFESDQPKLFVVNTPQKKRNFSEEAKIAQQKQQQKEKRQIDAKIKKASEKSAYAVKNILDGKSSQDFSAGKNNATAGFVLPESQHQTQNALSYTSNYFSLNAEWFNEKHNNFYESSISKTLGYSERFSVRPPPVLL